MRSKKRRELVAVAALALSTALMAMPAASMAAQPWSMENGQFVAADGSVIAGALEKGITISKYQNQAGAINWDAVANDQVSFAMVRLGYHNDLDPYFDQNMKDAAAHGIKTGIFLYTQALNTQTAAQEAAFVLEQIKDYPVSYPVAYDVESQYLLDHGLTRQQITDQINAFCRVISDAGYRPVVYGSNYWLTTHMDTAQIPYDIWYARYGAVNQYQNRTIWQCTDEGRVEGITGPVCIEFSFADYGQLFPGTGWRQINGQWYYYIDYVKQANMTVTYNGADYTLDQDGVWIP